MVLHVERSGEGKLLVCLHGWGMNMALEQADFEPVFLGRGGWERAYVDLPGMGRSVFDARVHTLDDLLRVLLEMLEVVTAGRPFALSGTSAGGYLARGVVAAWPERVLGLMLRVPKVNPGWEPHDSPGFQPWLEDSALMACLPELDRADLTETLVQTPEYVQAFLHKQRTLIQPALAQYDEPALSVVRQNPLHYGFSQEPEQQPFTRPTLIVTGRQDTVTGYRDAWKLLEYYPHATYAVLDRAGHEWPLPYASQPALFASLVGDWLNRMEEYR